MQISQTVSDIKYNPAKFSAAIYRSVNPKYTALIFANGKMVLTGTKGLDVARSAVNDLVEVLSKAQVDTTCERLVVKNYVVAYDTMTKINLIRLYYLLNREASYEPEIFPGLVFKPRNLSVTLVFFNTGKVNTTGIKQEKHIEKSISVINFIISDLKSRQLVSEPL